MIEFRDVVKEFPDGTRAVRDFSLVIPSHKTTVFVGSSGCGKTTLLRMINRMVEPSSGAIEIDGESVATGSPCSCVAASATSCRTPACSRTSRSPTTSRRSRC